MGAGGNTPAAHDLRPSRLYCRPRNFTESCLSARGLYRRWGITPRPEDSDLITCIIGMARWIVKGFGESAGAGKFFCGGGGATRATFSYTTGGSVGCFFPRRAQRGRPGCRSPRTARQAREAACKSIFAGRPAAAGAPRAGTGRLPADRGEGPAGDGGRGNRSGRLFRRQRAGPGRRVRVCR